MSGLKTLKTRIKSVKSTQKITKAMKMVASSRLRRARQMAESLRPYAERLETMVATLGCDSEVMEEAAQYPLLAGRESSNTHLVIVVTSDRGLCGGFNSSVVRKAKHYINRLEKGEGKIVKILCIGRKGSEQLKAKYGDQIINVITGLVRSNVSYSEIEKISNNLLASFDGREFDNLVVIYSAFKSAISQDVIEQQLIPVELKANNNHEINSFEYEPNKTELFSEVLTRNLAIQIYHAILESAASEQGARMTAMENASKNAGEMIKDLSLLYNRTRQANITRELIEIISGAEAL